MRIFITGGTGFIGRAVIAELAARGHAITALNRSPEKEPTLRALGASPVEGELGEPDSYISAAVGHDALLHRAFSSGTDTVDADRTAIETLLWAARETIKRQESEGGDNPVSAIYTSGCWTLGDTGGKLVDEGAPSAPAEVVVWRSAHEQRMLEAAGEGLVTAVVRPGMVYGGRGGLAGRLFESAVEEGEAEYVGDAENHWSMVHREDLARLYALVIERSGSGVFHGVDGHPVRVLDAARAASEAAGAGGAVRSLPLVTGAGAARAGGRCPRARPEAHRPALQRAGLASRAAFLPGSRSRGFPRVAAGQGENVSSGPSRSRSTERQPRYALSWSGGKDSTHALHRALERGLHITHLFNIFEGSSGRLRFHGVRRELIAAQAEALGLRLLQASTEPGDFEAAFQGVLHRLAELGIQGVVFGNVHLETGDPAWLGRELDAALIEEIAGREEVDPCGERGEYHSFVWDGPLFRQPVEFRVGEAEEREGHRYLDLLQQEGPGGVRLPATGGEQRRGTAWRR